MVSEDSQGLGRFAVIHGLCDLCDLDQSRQREMSAVIHETNHLRELVEVISLRGPQRVVLEIRDDDVPDI